MKLPSGITALILYLSIPALAGNEAPAVSVLPAFSSCANLVECAPGLVKLDDAEQASVRRLLDQVPAGETEAQISLRFGRAPFSSLPPIAAWGAPRGTMTSKSLWSLATPPGRASDEHFDVLFMNGKAVMFTWYAARLRKIAYVQIAP